MNICYNKHISFYFSITLRFAIIYSNYYMYFNTIINKTFIVYRYIVQNEELIYNNCVLVRKRKRGRKCLVKYFCISIKTFEKKLLKCFNYTLLTSFSTYLMYSMMSQYTCFPSTQCYVWCMNMLASFCM